jgi:hypothetical protein
VFLKRRQKTAPFPIETPPFEIGSFVNIKDITHLEGCALQPIYTGPHIET